MADFTADVYMAIARRPVTCFLAVLSLGVGVVAFLCFATYGDAILEMRMASHLASAGDRPIVSVSIWPAPHRPRGGSHQPGVPRLANDIGTQMGRKVAFAVYLQWLRNAKVGRHAMLSGFAVIARSGNWDVLTKESARMKVQGRLIGNDDDEHRASVCTLNKSLAELMFPGVNPVGRTIRFGGWPYRIVGVVAPALSELDTPPQAYLPASTAMEASQGQSCAIGEIVVLSDETRVSRDLQHVAAIVSAEFPQEAARVRVHSPWLDLQRERREVTRTKILVGLLSVTLLVSGLLGLVNMLLANVAGRAWEIGVRRALGATRWGQAIQVLAQALVLGALGGLAGIAGGTAVIHYLRSQVGLNLVPRPEWLAAALLAGPLTALLAGLIPARAAMKISPAEALRAE